MEPKKVIEGENISYYGKKQYLLSPLIARKKKPEERKPDYRDELSEQELTKFNQSRSK